jgi:hypothetical protein
MGKVFGLINPLLVFLVFALGGTDGKGGSGIKGHFSFVHLGVT